MQTPESYPREQPPADLAALSVDMMIRRIRDTQAGFLTDREVATLARHPEGRSRLLLIRAHGCRCLAPAQDVAFLVDAINKAGGCVRDVSLPAERS